MTNAPGTSDDLSQMSGNLDSVLGAVAILGILLPFATVVTDAVSFDPQRKSSFIAYVIGILLWAPWIWSLFKGRSLATTWPIAFVVPFVLVVQLVALLVFSFWIAAHLPRVIVNVEQKNLVYDFEIRSRGINGLLRLTVSDAETRELCWSVDLNYYNGTRLTYGEVPQKFKTSNNDYARDGCQVYPAGLGPQPLAHDRRFLVEVEYQFDVFVAPSAGVECVTFSTDHQGRVVGTSPVPPGTYGPSRKPETP